VGNLTYPKEKDEALLFLLKKDVYFVTLGDEHTVFT
jgi:hypothetical protein